jgi:hypothetical protein
MAVGDFLEAHPGIAAAGEANGCDRRALDHLKAKLWSDAVDELNCASRKACCRRSGYCTLSEEAAGRRVGCVDFGDDRASSSDRRGEVTTGDGIEGEREVIWSEDEDCAIEGFLLAADTGCGIDGRACKAACANCLCREAKLIDGTWELDRSKAWLNWQTGFGICRSDKRILCGFQVGCIGIKELCPNFGIKATHRGFRSGSSGQDCVDILWARDWICTREQLAGGGIGGLKGAGWISGCTPGAIDENREKGCGRHTSILTEDVDRGRRLLAQQQDAA